MVWAWFFFESNANQLNEMKKPFMCNMPYYDITTHISIFYWVSQMKFEPKSICHVRNTNMCVNFNMKIYLPFYMIAINLCEFNLSRIFFYVKSISWLLISTILIETFHRQSPHSQYGFTFTCFIFKWIMTKQQ